MMTNTDTDLLTFEEFRAELQDTEYSIRLALAALNLRPVTVGRRTYYKREWLPDVKQWLAHRARGY